MEVISHVSDRDMNDRLRETYATAQSSQDRLHRVSIHVGQGIWDHLKSLATEPSEGPAFPERNLWYGFPVVPMRGHPVDMIEVRTTVVIL